MRVQLGTIDVSDEQRRLLGRRMGKTGNASREDVRRFIIDHGLADLAAAVAEEAENDPPDDKY